VEDVTKAKYFVVLCDETTDSSHQEQLCLCIRFIDCVADKHRIREEFVEFQSAVDLTGEGLAAKILCILHAHQLDVKHMVGQGYDGRRLWPAVSAASKRRSEMPLLWQRMSTAPATC